MQRYDQSCNNILPKSRQISSVSCFAIEIGSRGIWTVTNKITLFEYFLLCGIKFVSRKRQKLIEGLMKMVIQCSYFIFKERKNRVWRNPKLINYSTNYTIQ